MALGGTYARAASSSLLCWTEWQMSRTEAGRYEGDGNRNCGLINGISVCGWLDSELEAIHVEDANTRAKSEGRTGSCECRRKIVVYMCCVLGGT